jgi:hypothetical protein
VHNVCKIVAMRGGLVHTVLHVRRRCLVCEAEEERDESETTDEIGPLCSSCHAPTERLAIIQRRTMPVVLNPHASALGRLGGLRGGPARAKALSAARRREIARRAARKRWGYED